MIRKKVLHLSSTNTFTAQVQRICNELPDCDHYVIVSRGGFRSRKSPFALNTWSSFRRIYPERKSSFTCHHVSGLQTYKRLFADADPVFDLLIVYGNAKLPRKLTEIPRVFIQDALAEPVSTDSPKRTPVTHGHLPFPHSSSSGFEDHFELYFVASEGDAQLLESAGIPANRIRVSGVPAFDHLAAFVNRKFRTTPYVLVCTSAIREKGGREDRMAFLEGCRRVACDQKLIFQLHPLEKHRRAVAEIEKVFGKNSEIYLHGSTGELVANCQELISHGAPGLYFALALGKKVHTSVSSVALQRYVPIQNGGNAALLIADILRAQFLEEELEFLPSHRYTKDSRRQSRGAIAHQNPAVKQLDAWAFHE